MLETGDKVLVVHRRLYEKDPIRIFTGKVLEYENGIAKIAGYTFVKDMFTGAMEEKRELRTKLLSVVSGTLIVYQLPSTVVPESLKFSLTQDGELVLTDEQGFSMDMSETVHKHELHS